MLHIQLLIMQPMRIPNKARNTHNMWLHSPLLKLAQVLLLSLSHVSVTVADKSEDCDNYSNDHVEQVQCISKRIKQFDGELNEIYKQALATLPERQDQDKRKEREQLRKSQRAWLKFKDENCALIGGLQGGNNLWVTHFAALCEEQQIKERIQFLKNIANEVNRL